MTKISQEQLDEITAAADRLPERYRVPAFQELLRHELHRPSQKSGREDDNDRGSGSDVGLVSGAPDKHAKWFQGVLDAMPEMHAFAIGNRDAQAAWALVETYRRGGAATVATTRALIKDELGISPESRTHMSNRLGDEFTPRYATRVKVEKGQGYRYEPTVKIVEKFPKEMEAE